jgi:hypothetical protein
VRLQHSQTGKFYGNARVVLRYSEKCATAWSEVTSADTTCYAIVVRVPETSGASYREPVERGLTYAYTKMLDDSNGKLAQALAYCRVIKKPDGSSSDFYYAETASY